MIMKAILLHVQIKLGENANLYDLDSPNSKDDASFSFLQYFLWPFDDVL